MTILRNGLGGSLLYYSDGGGMCSWFESSDERAASRQKSPAGRSDELIAVWKALKQTLRVSLRT